MKLFEIPVYALSRDNLNKKVMKAQQRYILTDLRNDAPEEHKKKCATYHTSPFSYWDYNHIVGVVVISLTKRDITLDYYTPINPIERYRWDSYKKYYLKDAQLNGCHRYLGSLNSGEELRVLIKELIQQFEKEHIKKNYFVDKEAYISLDEFLDYDKLLRG